MAPKTGYMRLIGTPLGSVKMQPSCHRSPEFKYLGRTLQSDGDITDMNAEVNKRTQCGWNNWRKMSGVICDKTISPHIKMIVQPATLHGMETVLMTGCHVKRLEVTEMKMSVATHYETM